MYSIRQDIELGRRASVEVERRMPIVKDPQIQEWIDQLGHRLSVVTTRPDLPWQFRVVNSNEVNAFSLPGGFVYVDKGLILMTDADGARAAKDQAMVALALPTVHPAVAPLVYAVPVQLLAYHTAVLMGTDVDQPRNLAKSVTVE